MAVAERRAAGVTGPRVLRRYEADRFSRPGSVRFADLRRVEDAFVRAVPDGWSWIVPSPLVPFGTHRALSGISQNRVVTAVRPNEVAADPTAALALEAAAARRETPRRRSEQQIRLACIQRVTRAQLFTDADAFAHFTVFGLVTAGRSRPNEGFDVDALVQHLSIHVGALRELVDGVHIILSTSTDRHGRSTVEDLRDAFTGDPHVTISDDRDRLRGQRYYSRACFKVRASVEDVSFEVSDGGFTDWTERLLDDRRERLLISATGLDRLAALDTAAS
jgi:hypothetical protein